MAETRLPERTDRTGQPGQNYEDSTSKIGKLKRDKHDGQASQDIHTVNWYMFVKYRKSAYR
jgi:hypothetical protein